ncbi:MAG: hypothetical protein Q7W54_08685 [Bacteroidota bacterium]|nr:hypothetical protein [Bacteroidota bacterium]
MDKKIREDYFFRFTFTPTMNERETYFKPLKTVSTMTQNHLVAIALEKINSRKDYSSLSSCTLSIRKTYNPDNLSNDSSETHPFIVDWQIPKSELNNTDKPQAPLNSAWSQG